jgi:hypothetical protein
MIKAVPPARSMGLRIFPYQTSSRQKRFAIGDFTIPADP